MKTNYRIKKHSFRDLTITGPHGIEFEICTDIDFAGDDVGALITITAPEGSRFDNVEVNGERPETTRALLRIRSGKQ
jgi:hypothetical protein